MGRRRIGRKRIESALKKLNATKANTAGSRAGQTGFDMPPWQLMPSKYFGIFDDFLVADGSTGLDQDEDMAQGSNIDGTVWRTNVDGTSDTIKLNNGVTGGVVEILHGTADNEESHMTAINHGFATDAASPRKMWATCRLKTSDSNATGLFIGLTSDNGDEEVSILTDGGGATEDAIGFYLLDGSAAETITLLTAVGDSETVTSCTDSFADDTYVTLSWYYNGSSVEAYVNGTLRATVTTNIPNDGTVMFPAIHVAAREGAANTVTVDYMVVCQER